jgi:hypothetical protein
MELFPSDVFTTLLELISYYKYLLHTFFLPSFLSTFLSAYLPWFIYATKILLCILCCLYLPLPSLTSLFLSPTPLHGWRGKLTYAFSCPCYAYLNNLITYFFWAYLSTLSHAHEGSCINKNDLLGIIREHTRTQKKREMGMILLRLEPCH